MTETEQDDDSPAPTQATEGGEKNDEQIAALREEQLETVRDADAEELADELAARRLEIEQLQAALDDLEETVAAKDEKIEDLTSRLKRKQADFQNYKKRMKEKREDEKQRATEDLVERLLDVRDNLQRALDQDDVADLRDGVESTLRQFETELDRENVTPIEPEPGDEVDPERHEVLVRMDSARPEGTIAEVHRPGYGMAGKVIRTAQVAVSDGPDGDESDDSAEGTEDGEAEADGTEDDEGGNGQAEEAVGNETADPDE